MTAMTKSFGDPRTESRLGNVDMKVASIFSLIIGLVFFGASPPSWAVDCKIHSGAYSDIKVALQLSKLTVPRDMPTGSVLYQQQVYAGGSAGYRIKCLTGVSLGGDVGASYYTLPTNGLARGGGGGVYETGVKGVGVKWTLGTSTLTQQREDNMTVLSPVACGSVGKLGTPEGHCLTATFDGPKSVSRIQISLIKTGPVGAGVIDGSALGVYRRSLDIDGATGTFLVDLINIVGRVDVVARTCKAQDVNVLMGSYKTSDFRGVGSEIAGKEFLIELLDCPGFPGNYEAGAVSTELGVVTAAPLSNNSISIQIDPVITPLDASAGILALTPGNDAAKGVGLKISRGGSAKGPVRLSQSFSTIGIASTPLAASTENISLRFSASYVKMEEVVTAGKANATATYTITYQ